MWLAKRVEFGSVPYTVIGVTPAGFKGTLSVINPDIAFVPMSMHAQALPSNLEQLFYERRMRLLNVLGRLKPDVSQPQASAQIATIATQLEQEYPVANKGRGTELDTVANAALGFIPRNQMVLVSLALSAVVGLVLLIACANLANLLLARAARRMREMGIRRGPGCGTRAAGKATSYREPSVVDRRRSGGTRHRIRRFDPVGGEVQPAGFAADSLQIEMDWRVFAFTAVVTLLTVCLFAVIPALRASSGDLGEVLKSGGGRGGTETFTRSRLRIAMVVGQVAFAMVALTEASLVHPRYEFVGADQPGV